jgi:hypothetical protein
MLTCGVYFKRTMSPKVCLLVVSLFLCLANYETAYPLEYNWVLGGGPGDCNLGNQGTWNPHLSDGMIAILTVHCSWDYSDQYGYQTGASNGAFYGSDSSWYGNIQQAMQIKSVEPMADAMAEKSGCGWYSSYARVEISAQHRVREREENPVPPDAPNREEILANIKLILTFRLSASSSSSLPGNTRARVKLLKSDETVLLDLSISNPPDYYGTWPLTAMNGEIFIVHARADATAGGDNTCQSFGQAVSDPFLQSDPTWEYAQHFVVEQESLLVPGEWKEVTRDWMYFCECDTEPDNDVDGTNLYAFMQDFGRINCNGTCLGDLDGDGMVNETDLALFAGDFGKVNCK